MCGWALKGLQWLAAIVAMHGEAVRTYQAESTGRRHYSGDNPKPSLRIVPRSLALVHLAGMFAYPTSLIRHPGEFPHARRFAPSEAVAVCASGSYAPNMHSGPDGRADRARLATPTDPVTDRSTFQADTRSDPSQSFLLYVRHVRHVLTKLGDRIHCVI